MLTAAAPLSAAFHPKQPLTNDAILSAYLGMQNPMTAQFAASKSFVCLVCVFSTSHLTVH